MSRAPDRPRPTDLRARARHALPLALSAAVACSSASSTPTPTPSPTPTASPDPRKLHVPSPDWSEQIIYFVLVDRFSNGDPSNDDQAAGEFDPADARKYSGGDLRGVADRLEYIQGLGATAVWITPPVANQWWDPLAQFGGYHGYGARDLRSVDPHLGTLETYKDLSHALHTRGMYLIQDVVPNHMGNFFTYPGAYDPADVAAGVVMNTESKPSARPDDPAFAVNDPRDAAAREAGVYHFTPSIRDYNDPTQERTWALSDLDDLATERPNVRALLRDRYGAWVRDVGVDGFRVDTAKFLEPDFWNAWLHDPTDGIDVVAQKTGREAFLTFGEIFETSGPDDTTAEARVRTHLGTPAAPGLDAGLGFPLYGTLIRVFAEGRPTEELAYRLTQLMDPAVVPNPFIAPNFVDNHDVARFAARGGEAGLRQALRTIFSVPGIPVIYQGTEQGLLETRPSMFAGGFGSDGVDHFDTTSSGYVALARLATLRRTHPVLSRGSLTARLSSPAGPGVLAWSRALDDARAVVVMNTAPTRTLVSGLTADLRPGQVLDVALGEGPGATVIADHEGKLTFELAPRASAILIARDETRPVTPPTAILTLDRPIPAETSRDLFVRGRSTAPGNVFIVVDDDLTSAIERVPVDGVFSATVALDRFDYGGSRHTITVYAKAANLVTTRAEVRVDRAFDGVRVDVDDPRGDDRGPTGTYLYPKDSTFTDQMDLLGATVEAGSTLALTLRMPSISTVWRPQNGFDHVCFHVFFEVPGQAGLRVLPLLDGETPEGFAWTHQHFGFGWSNVLRGTAGASATQDGTPLAGAPLIRVSPADGTIRFTYARAPFGLRTWTGVKIWVATWDYDGVDNRLRGITPDGGPWTFGGAPEGSPKLLDTLGPITIRER
jgi:glycosidase